MAQKPGLVEVNPALVEASRQVLEYLSLAGEEWSGLVSLPGLVQRAVTKEIALPGQKPWDYAYGAACEIIYAGCTDLTTPGYSLAYRWLRRYILDLFKNQFKVDETAAEDLAGDVVEIIIKKLEQVRFPTAFLVWVAQVARNTFKDYLSKKDRFKTVGLPSHGPTGTAQALEKVRGLLKLAETEIADPSPAANPETAVLDNELRARLLESIKAMRTNTRNSRLCRQIITGFYFENKSVEELAGLLGLSPVKVTKLKSQALLNLRKTWQKYENQNGL